MRRPDPAGAGRIGLATILNLLRGTLSVSPQGKHLHLHVLERRRPIVDRVRFAERHLARMPGLQQAA